MAYAMMYTLHDLLWINQELVILSMARYDNEFKQENDHSIFVSLKMIILLSTLFLFHICIFAYFVVDNYDKYQFCIFSLIKFAYDKSGEIKCDITQYE